MINHPRQLTRPHYVREANGPVGAGANFVWTPPVRTHVELVSLAVTFTTSAGGATRGMRCVIGGAAAEDFNLQVPTIQAVGQTHNYYWGRGIGSYWTTLAYDYWLGTLPKGLLFAFPTQLRSEIISLNALDVIDNWTIRYRLWQDPVIL